MCLLNVSFHIYFFSVIMCWLYILQLQSLLPFQQVSPTENVVEEYGLKDADLPKQLFS